MTAACTCGLHNDRETACTCDGRYASAAQPYDDALLDEHRMEDHAAKSAACKRDPNEVEALLRQRGLGESVCPADGLRPGQHGWSAAYPYLWSQQSGGWWGNHPIPCRILRDDGMKVKIAALRPDGVELERFVKKGSLRRV